MHQLDALMTRISKWSLTTYEKVPVLITKKTPLGYTWTVRGNGFYIRHVATRIAVLGCIPLEVLAALQNLIKLPFQPLGAFVKYPLKAVNCLFHSETLYGFDRRLSGFSDILETAAKAAGYILGLFLTASYGLCEPCKNIAFHQRLGLYVPATSESQKCAEEVKKFKKRIKTFGLTFPPGRTGGVFEVDLNMRKWSLDLAAEARGGNLRIKWLAVKILASTCKKHQLRERKERLEQLKLHASYFNCQGEVDRASIEYEAALQRAIRKIKHKLLKAAQDESNPNFKEFLTDLSIYIHDLESYFGDKDLIGEDCTYKIASADSLLNKKFDTLFQKEREEALRTTLDRLRKITPCTDLQKVNFNLPVDCKQEITGQDQMKEFLGESRLNVPDNGLQKAEESAQQLPGSDPINMEEAKGCLVM